LNLKIKSSSQGHKEDLDFAHFGEILTTSSFRLPILDLDSNHKKKADKKAKKSSNKSNYKMYYSYQIRLNIKVLIFKFKLLKRPKMAKTWYKGFGIYENNLK